ncbi:hypothetical protein AKJ16_DCAP06266 [Drosera capensis]
MRLEGEITEFVGEDEVNCDGNELISISKRAELIAVSVGLSQQQVVVGYALTSKKQRSFLQPKLEILARGIQGIESDRNLESGICIAMFEYLVENIPRNTCDHI